MTYKTTTRYLVGVATAVALIGVASSWHAASADPCGMVPPIQMVERDAITRIGLQKTYVAYHKGVETMVLRPGFRGKVDEFGMLIPFPSVPAIRKVDDNIFPHIAAAVDPPEVVAYVMRYQRKSMTRGMSKQAIPSSAAGDAGLSYDTVRVVKREAVGMYDVAVLEAGSPKALERWMDDHGFRYPAGMDTVVQDYVDSRWVFVAIKTKVGRKDGVNPRPGMRSVDTKLPAGSSFDGHVQAMGFRFRTDKLVVPMRLSAFNPGELRNVVYILTNGPRHIEDIPKRYVVRQISGKELLRNVTKPLPLRVIGGTYKDLEPWQKQNLRTQRDPKPHNGKARELFASDLLAMYSGRLANPFEEDEKDLLAIGERLGLRGLEIDRLHDDVLARQRTKAGKKALKHLDKLTMTVVDGDFERDVLARQNLEFARYRMPRSRNKRTHYDATRFGPVPNMGGKLYKSSNLDHVDRDDERAGAREDTGFNRPKVAVPWFKALLGAGAVFVLLGLGWRRRMHGRHASRHVTWLALVIVIAAGATIVGASSTRLAWGVPASDLKQLIADLGDAEKAENAVRSLKAFGDAAVNPLVDAIVDSDDDEMVRAGWAVIALAEIGTPRAGAELEKLHQDARRPMLVRTWAAAARVDMAGTPDGVLALMPLGTSFPAVQRALTNRILETLERSSGEQSVEAMLAIAARVPNLRAQMGTRIVQAGAPALVGAMAHASDDNTRRMAAGYLANIGASKPDDVAAAVVEAYAFDKRAKDVPWSGGALFVPSIRWSKTQAHALVDSLIRWHLWAERHGKADYQQQIHNNLRSLSLAQVVGYQSPGWNPASTDQWLGIWGRIIGAKAMRSLLAEQGVARDKRYKAILSGL